MTEQLRDSKVVMVFSGSPEDGDWPPENADDFIIWFNEKLALAPAEWKGSVKIIVSAKSNYQDDHELGIEIFYKRPETDDEIIARNAKAASVKAGRVSSDLKLLARLKLQYE